MSVEVWDHDELLGLASERIVEYIDNLEARIERADAVIRDTAAYEGSQQARIEALEARVNLSARHPTDQFIEGVMMRDTKILEQVERIETLMRGLKCYGVHGHYCGYVTDANEPNGSPDIVGKCTCGLDALRDDSGGKLPWETTEACAEALREQLAARAEDAERIKALEAALPERLMKRVAAAEEELADIGEQTKEYAEADSTVCAGVELVMKRIKALEAANARVRMPGYLWERIRRLHRWLRETRRQLDDACLLLDEEDPNER